MLWHSPLWNIFTLFRNLFHACMQQCLKKKLFADIANIAHKQEYWCIDLVSSSRASLSCEPFTISWRTQTELTPIPSCLLYEGILCSDPGAPVNGTAIGTNFAYQSVVQFICNDNFTLSGSLAIECLATGEWNASLPTCDPGKWRARIFRCCLDLCCLTRGKGVILEGWLRRTSSRAVRFTRTMWWPEMVIKLIAFEYFIPTTIMYTSPYHHPSLCVII